jgi:3-methylfumaryl-CoA hydratase
MLQEWVGRGEVVEDRVTPVPIAALAATLDRDDPPPRPGDAVPPLWHWLYFLPLSRQSMLGPDGHPRRGGFLPPVGLPRRMWAGGRLSFPRPLRVGERIRRTSTIADVTHRTGRSGALVFVLVRHEVAGEDGVAVIEEHDIVYREAARPGEAAPAPRPAPADALWRRTVAVDPVLLFRYSALTFNGHRIHYDHRYVTEEEGYPGLVVHGPLIATLLADLLRRHDNRSLAAFRFRAVRPLFDTAPFSVCGAPSADGSTATLWAADGGDALAMEAEAAFAPAAGEHALR